LRPGEVREVAMDTEVGDERKGSGGWEYF
jgi:hypothetical protein